MKKSSNILNKTIDKQKSMCYTVDKFNDIEQHDKEGVS